MGIEDFCYVGDCSVCEETVDHSEAGFCKICGEPFHWSMCGGWAHWEEGYDHICNNCQEEE
jgi:hypothetical protein